MRYYAQYKDGIFLGIGTGYGGTSGEEITEAEYNRLLTEIKAKAKWVDDVYGGAPIADAPKEWQEEIQQRVEQRKRWEAEQAKEKVSDAELAQAVEGIL